MRTSIRLALATLTATGAACGGEPSDGPRTPSRLTPASGEVLTGTVGTSLAGIKFVVADAQGPMPGVRVTFGVSDTRGFASPAEATSDSSGTVTTTWTLGGVVGQQALTASVSGVSPATVNAQVAIGPLAAVSPTSTANQFVVIGGTVASPPAVRATDAFGNPIAGQAISFADPTGRSTIVGTTGTTDADGRAGVTSWTIGSAPGAYSLTATATPTVAAGFSAFGHPAVIQVAGGNNQTANAGTLLGQAPAIEALGPQNEPVPGVAVTFAITGGGGRLLGATTTLTGADGIARSSEWILGNVPGSNTASALVNGLPLLEFTATGVAAVPALMEPSAPTALTGLEGNYGTVRPAIRLVDADGKPVAGRPVTFTAAGGGILIGASTTSDFRGEARLASWRFGTGPQTVTATTAALDPVVFSASTAPPPASGYSIQVRFVGSSPTASQREAFERAAARWSTILLGDLESVPFTLEDDMSSCGAQPLDETVDDLLIFARIQRIDGPGGILGQARPCYVREPSLHSIVGYMEFDADDVVNLEAAGNFDNVVLHEMAHVIGVGSLWSFQGLAADLTTGDPYFTGPSAQMAFAAAHSAYLGRAVPIENTGGAGTRGGHWREGILANELMTGFLNTGINPLSAITAASLRDQGYLVSDAGADAFSLNAALRALSTPAFELHTIIEPTVLRSKDSRGNNRVVLSRSGPIRSGAVR
ncbi:MAG: Ig-like domain-containing protein [Gemmatimonadales bacterium]